MLDQKLGLVHNDLAAIHSKLSTTKQEIFVEIRKEINFAIEKINQEFTATTDRLDDQISCFKADLSSLDVKVKELASENSRLNAELLSMKNNSQNKMTETSTLHDIVDQMKLEINDRDQALLLNDVEISGVPEHKSESTIHIVQTIALKIGLNIDERDIVSANRVGQPRTSNTEGGRSHQDNRTSSSETASASANQDLIRNSGSASGPRPRPLVVRFTRRALRDELLKSARSRRGLDSRDVGPPDHIPTKLYLNDRLTKTNRSIFWQARQAANAANWKYVWTRDGRIYARRSDSGECKAVPIKTEKDIARVFGVAPSSSSASK
ncbi:uncharacterized protein LOC125234864 [Leguminivora glycinivorella]|uniref:uncharacterized protein LOC125234864 n=1 Tax=Leguminivora glycinivorella TaxID=1035111 RepID=UPI00200D1A01|nr:uncharacterized protein LOC125234864 [Leguminivora glycinivorella]